MAKFPPSLYLVDDKILIRSRGRGKVSNTGVYEGEVIKTNYNRHTYKVRLKESGSKFKNSGTVCGPVKKLAVYVPSAEAGPSASVALENVR